jgi:hypothetical protein
MRAQVHNAKAATLLGVDCWLGVIYVGSSNRFTGKEVSPEFDTSAEAVAWCRDEMQRRGAPGSPVFIDGQPK